MKIDVAFFDVFSRVFSACHFYRESSGETQFCHCLFRFLFFRVSHFYREFLAENQHSQFLDSEQGVTLSRPGGMRGALGEEKGGV